jgi:cysteine desulfurase
MPYLDHAATTPLLPDALAAMTEALSRHGNASSLHTSGRAARAVLEEAREAIAGAYGARPGDVVFTAGGTEADNLAVKGLFWARRDADPRRTRIVTSPVEHHAVLDTVAWLAAHEGARVELVDVDSAGRVDPESARRALERDPGTVALVTVMWANNEIGTIQPVAELAGICQAAGVPMHSDAVAAAASLPISFSDSGLAAVSLTAHKVGGPVGVGALLVDRAVTPVPLLHGGGQERDVRSGTLNVAGAAGFAAAVLSGAAGRDERNARLARLRDQLVAGVQAVVPDVVVNGDPRPDHRLPGLAHLSFPGCDGDALLMLLDARGVECSTGSACSAGVPEPSHVVLATGLPAELAAGSLRFSLGHDSTADDVDALLEVIGPVVERARRAGHLRPAPPVRV